MANEKLEQFRELASEKWGEFREEAEFDNLIALARLAAGYRKVSQQKGSDGFGTRLMLDIEFDALRAALPDEQNANNQEESEP